MGALGVDRGATGDPTGAAVGFEARDVDGELTHDAPADIERPPAPIAAVEPLAQESPDGEPEFGSPPRPAGPAPDGEGDIADGDGG